MEMGSASQAPIARWLFFSDRGPHHLQIIMTIRSFPAMLLATALSNTQIYVALVIALIPAVLAFRLSTELYK
jgi:photosystem I subunit XII